MALINPKRINEIFLDCLVCEGEPTNGNIQVEGITCTVNFQPKRLASHREEISKNLRDLPFQFQTNGGGGWSFLNACDDRKGDQWTGLHLRMEQLFQLGIGLRLAKWLMPRDLWPHLPGGVPYVVIFSQTQEPKT